MSPRTTTETTETEESRVMDEASELLPVLVAWKRLAARAWEGYLAEGLGTVTVDVGATVAFGYQLGSPCECHAEWVDAYDPEREVVLLVRCGESDWIYRLGGWPTPPQAFAQVTAADLEATLH